MRKYRRLMLVGLGLGLLVIIAVMLLSDVEQLMHYALAFPWWLMLPVLALRAVNWALRFVKWHFYLRLVGVRNLSAPDSAAVFLTGFPLAISPGKVAEILKSFILYNMTGAPVMSTLPVVAAERFSDGLAVLLLVALSIINLAAHEYWPMVIIFLGLLGAGIILLQIRPLCLLVLRWLARLPLVGRFAHSFGQFYESSYRIVLLPNLIVAVALGFVANFLDGIGVFLILAGLGLPADATTFYQALLVISLSVVAGSLSGMPGAIGAADLTITGSLQKLVGLSVPQAGFATLLSRFVQLWFGVLVGSVVAFIFRQRLFPETLEQVIRDHETHGDAPPVPQRAVSMGD